MRHHATAAVLDGAAIGTLAAVLMAAGYGGVSLAVLALAVLSWTAADTSHHGHTAAYAVQDGRKEH
jgi:hypothetical protein